jgi:hypothetical protein
MLGRLAWTNHLPDIPWNRSLIRAESQLTEALREGGTTHTPDRTKPLYQPKGARARANSWNIQVIGLYNKLSENRKQRVQEYHPLDGIDGAFWK